MCFVMLKGEDIMTTVSLLLFIFGAIVLWGGLALSIGIFFHNERKIKKN